jgi:putative SOS response-associated peptidase YedK
MLCEADAWDVWLTGSSDEALALQAPLPASRLSIVEKNILADAVGQGA